MVRDLHFAFDSSKIDARDKDQLDTIASRLRGEAASTELNIAGHTDSVGTDAYNQTLSEKRANAVANYLVDAGVPASSIKSVSGYGESQPVADNKTSDGRAQNRRVEIQIKRE
ncbi:Outer membrane porin F precursor [compost metagenome]